MLNHLKKLDFAGDTIVEVMLVLAVLGLAISISYATANRSLLNARQAQESAEATQLVQSQVEALRTMSTNTSPSIFAPSTWPSAVPYKCVSQSVPYSVTSSCTVGLYSLSVTYDASAKVFTATATWDDVAGQGTDKVSLVYRVYQPS